MNNNLNVRKITIIGLGIALNVIGAFVALTLRLPVYLDSIGTILIACLLGPKYAVATGICGSLVSGMTFDVYSLYFAPVQITTGYFAGIMYNKSFLKGKKTPLGVLIMTIPTSIIGACITAYIFGGITSSGSSYIVQILNTMQVPDVVSIFITQVFTDYADEFIAVSLVAIALNYIPKGLKLSLTVNKQRRQNG